ncbi:MAG: CDP-paratose 2-epimerase [Patescibacteria group bacterium]|nr:MAG: CDP-paratose 2-epimerase [Patescibacteria group bacterium]
MKYLITGGAGFIGTNFSNNLLSRGDKVIILDNFSKKGSSLNAQWLLRRYGKNKLTVIKADIRFDTQKLEEQVVQADIIYHLAAQTAVTTSVQNPREDFEINAVGTFNLLEAIRKKNPKAILVYSSTNKVYGNMQNIPITESKTRYLYSNINGISESNPLDLYSPYGCSKGAADQYVRDYSRIYGLSTVVFRQSCIYGPHQFGVEDQGWVAWFVIALLLNRKITIFGNGKQTRDVLYIDDLFSAWDLATRSIEKTKGEIFNIGGGPSNSISIIETLSLLEKKLKKKIEISYDDWRPGDQKIFVSNNRKLIDQLGWRPKTDINFGLEKLIEWVLENKDKIEELIDN